MCLYPRLIKNRKYTKNKKNGGVVPPLYDKRVEYVAVGCQECIECRKQKSREWQVRLLEDLKTHNNGKFVTLTFSNESIADIITKSIKKTNPETGAIENVIIGELKGYEKDNAIATYAVRHFVERYRKHHKVSIRHWLITELGHRGTENIHLHGIIWTNDDMEYIEKVWSYGFIWKGYKKENGKYENYVNDKTVNYIIKYVSKIDHQHKGFKGKILCSPGIGGNYTNRSDSDKNVYRGKDTIETYRTTTGHEIALPIYYRNKIYTDSEKELLWVQKLDKNERWVCKERVDISRGEEQYIKLRAWYRRINAELGYGTGIVDKARMDYESNMREIMYSERIRNTRGTTKQ